MYGSWDMVLDGHMEGKKWHREVGAPPRKNQYFEQSATLFWMKKKKEL